MKKFYSYFNHWGMLASVVLILASANFANAQYLRSSYFMDGSQYRLMLNPALAPAKGFVHLPAIGNTNASVRSNSLGFEDVLDIIKNKDDGDYFMSERFVNNLMQSSMPVPTCSPWVGGKARDHSGPSM